MTRSERIREAIRITDLLAELGYAVQPVEREQQFGCDLHGTRDGKPSARVYPASNSWYCFACGKSRDVIGTVMDKLELDFKKSMAWLEKTYKLPTYTNLEAPKADLMDDLKATFTQPQDDNAARVSVQIRAVLNSQRHDKALTCQQTMELWAQYDEAMAKLEAEPATATKALLALQKAMMEQVRRASRTA